MKQSEKKRRELQSTLAKLQAIKPRTDSVVESIRMVQMEIQLLRQRRI